MRLHARRHLPAHDVRQLHAPVRRRRKHVVRRLRHRLHQHHRVRVLPHRPHERLRKHLLQLRRLQRFHVLRFRLKRVRLAPRRKKLRPLRRVLSDVVLLRPHYRVDHRLRHVNVSGVGIIFFGAFMYDANWKNKFNSPSLPCRPVQHATYVEEVVQRLARQVVRAPECERLPLDVDQDLVLTDNQCTRVAVVVFLRKRQRRRLYFDCALRHLDVPVLELVTLSGQHLHLVAKLPAGNELRQHVEVVQIVQLDRLLADPSRGSCPYHAKRNAPKVVEL